MPSADVIAELKGLIDEFFRAVSFESGESPAYARIRDLFIDDGTLIRNGPDGPEIWSVDEFVAARQGILDSGALTAFAEVEIAATNEAFGNAAHRFSTYQKHGTLDGEAINGSGLISTQFIRTPSGWKMSSMAWDDERPGLAIPDRYR
ncbi:MAG TPA: hypothetical protein VH247_10315 [Thermoleophilaceae bacterium]|nr:hypothetical protein [Thermoleophilaceae bacterium]